MNISLTPLATVLPEPARVVGPAAGTGFADAIASAIGQVETAQTGAKSAARELLFDGTGDIHNVALLSQRAALSVELFQQVRNKFVSAYQEIMKMPM